MGDEDYAGRYTRGLTRRSRYARKSAGIGRADIRGAPVQEARQVEQHDDGDEVPVDL